KVAELLGVQSRESLSLLYFRGASHTEPKPVGRTRADILGRFGDHALGQTAGGLEKGFVVEERERLQGRVGAHPSHRAGLAARGVEGHEAGIGRRAPKKSLQAAAVTVFAFAVSPLVLAVRIAPDPLRLRRKNARPADLAA